jgi:hypothetical protein
MGPDEVSGWLWQQVTSICAVCGKAEGLTICEQLSQGYACMQHCVSIYLQSIVVEIAL